MPPLGYRQMPPAPDAVTAEDELESTVSELYRRAVACDHYENDEAIDAIFQAVQDGLLTPEEATDLVLGKML
jgi:hypothetical protein